ESRSGATSADAAQSCICDRVVLSHRCPRQRRHSRRDAVNAFCRLPTLWLGRLAVILVVVLQLQATGHPVEYWVIAVADFLVHIRAQQKLGWVAQVQKTLRYFDCLDTLIEQLHRLRPKIEAIERHFTKLEQLAPPVNTLFDRAHVNPVAGSSLDKTLPDPCRIGSATYAFKFRHAIRGHPEEGQQRPD